MNYIMYQQQQWRGSDALENQHSTHLRSTEQDVLFKQLQNSSPKRKRDAYRKRVKTSESLKFQLTSCKQNQNTECQSECNKGMRPGWSVFWKLWHIKTTAFKKFMTNLRKWKKFTRIPRFPISSMKPKSYGDKTLMPFVREACVAFPAWSLNFYGHMYALRTYFLELQAPLFSFLPIGVFISLLFFCLWMGM